MGLHNFLSASPMDLQPGQPERLSLLTLGQPAVTQGMLSRPPRNKQWPIEGCGVVFP